MLVCGHPELSLRRQCGWLGLNRASLYYVPAQANAANQRLRRFIDVHSTGAPVDGSRRMTVWAQALAQGQPQIFNTDHGAQLTSLAFTRRLEVAQRAISMEGIQF